MLITAIGSTSLREQIVYTYRRLFTKCKYYSICRYRDRESETCLCGGGQHCGYWKELEEIKWQ